MLVAALLLIGLSTGRSRRIPRHMGWKPMLRELRQNLLHHMSIHIREAEVAAGVAVGEFFVIQAQRMQDRRVHVVHVDLVLDRLSAEFVRGAVAEARLEAGSAEPLREAAGVVIAAGAVALGVGGATEFAAP